MLAVCVVAVVVTVGCSSTPDDRPSSDQWLQEYQQIMRMDLEEADEALADLAARTASQTRVRDIQFERARLALRADDVERARQRFEDIWEERSDDAVASRSMYELARIAAEHDDDLDEAHRLLRRAITETFPWAGSELALQYLVRTERRADRIPELVASLEAMAAGSDDQMAAQLHLERGLLLDEKLGQPNRALDAYRAAHARAPECGATDEALYQMGEIYARHLMWEPALTAYGIVAGRTGRSFFIGTYTSQRAADARYRLGMIELLYRQRYDAARHHFRTYIKQFPNHLKTDDAAWNLVQIERLDGTAQSYRRALERFVDDYPHSRLVDDARRQLAEVTT